MNGIILFSGQGFPCIDNAKAILSNELTQFRSKNFRKACPKEEIGRQICPWMPNSQKNQQCIVRRREGHRFATQGTNVSLSGPTSTPGELSFFFHTNWK